MTIPVNTKKELKWKKLDGTLVSFNQLSNQELKECRKIAGKKIETYYRNFEFFTDLQEQMDIEVHKRLEEAKELVQELEKTKKEN